MSDIEGFVEIENDDRESQFTDELESEEKKKDEENAEPEKNQPKKARSKKKKGKKGKKAAAEKGAGSASAASAAKKKTDAKPPSPRVISSKSIFAQIAKELKAKRLAQIAYAGAMSKKRRKNRVLRDEEVYTDKDRAAAVNMGTSDIKQSLKMKKNRDKIYDSQTPEEGDPATLLALGNNELRSGDLKIALNFINKALELNPDDKNGLVARSKCYLALGDPQLALQDAETALALDKTFVRAIYQKAEALYHLGDFEHSLMYYHRGHRLRPELESFRLGVQKAQEAIENTIGSTGGGVKSLTKKISSELSSAKTCESNRNEQKLASSEAETKRSHSSFGSEKENRVGFRSRSTVSAVRTSKQYHGDLGVDRLYLENLIKHPDLVCSNQEAAANLIKVKAEEGITFIKSRQEFWKQQKPNAVTGDKKK